MEHENRDALRLTWANQIAFMRRAWVKHLTTLPATEYTKDMFLDLYIAEAEGTRVSVTDLFLVARTPPTTGLRWVSAMEKQQLIVRTVDPSDRRRSFLRLSPQCRAAVEDFLDEVIAALPKDQPAGAAELPG